jgi:dynein heavy chain
MLPCILPWYQKKCFSCRLKLPCLDTLGKWKYAVSLFMKDLQFVQTEYMENKENPPLARNLPPVSGKIAWSRQLYRRIAGPVEVFQTNQQLMQLPETKKAIKKFNRLARVLVEYELVFLQIWTKQIDAARVSLNATVLIRHPDTKELYVNFDHKISELVREVDVLRKMGEIEIPHQAKAFSGIGGEMKIKYELLTVS